MGRKEKGERKLGRNGNPRSVEGNEITEERMWRKFAGEKWSK